MRKNGKKNDNNWISEYIELMLADDPEHAIPLKDQHFPKAFFKYRSLNENTLNSLEENTLWLSEIHKLNDPFECAMLLDHNACLRLTYSSDSYRAEFKSRFGFEIPTAIIAKIVNSNCPDDVYREFCASNGIVITQSAAEQKDRIMAGWEEIRNDTNKNIRVSCFSERNDSILMWSHYASQHQGVCIEYDFTEADEIRYLIQPAFYSDSVFQLGTMEDLTSVSHLMSSLYKAKDWAYEAEWRLTGIPKDGKVPEKVKAPLPQAIYLGTRFTQSDLAHQTKLLEIARSHNIPVYEMTLHDSEYKVVKK